MSKGRKPKPAKVHQLEGTYRSDRHGQASDHPETISGAGQMPCPSWVPERSRKAFKKLRDDLGPSGMDVLAEQDRHALIMLAEAWDEWRQAKDIIKREGLTYDTFTEGGALMKRAHPAVAIRNDADRRIKSWLAEFGLTPSSRPALLAQLGKMAKGSGDSGKSQQSPKKKRWMKNG